MFKSILSKVGWGELPSSFGYSIGEKVDLPFQWHWELHKGQKRADGSLVSVFVCGKKDLDSSQVVAVKNAEQMAKCMKHPNILRTLDSIEVEGGFYLVTEPCVPLLGAEVAESDERQPAVWGLYQALDALSFLHQSGFTHGLFGPSSIFVTPQGDYRLGAFELCKKGADATSLIAGRRRSGPSFVGLPDPPAQLSDGTAPTQGIDFWGVAVLMAYVFGTARAGRHGADYRVDLAKAGPDLPPELRKPFMELQRPGPLRGRSPIADLAALQYFQQNPSVQVMGFLSQLHIRSVEEKECFFSSLPRLLENVPQSMQTKQVLPELLTAQKFPGQEAAQVLPSILKISVRLKDDEFKDKIAPLVVNLFTMPDRAVRFRLLSSLGEMIDMMDDAMINDKIFPECVNGFTDSNGPIREASVKSLIFFVPRLKAKTVETRVSKILVKLTTDPEASIRTNAVICCGRISSHLPKAVANQTLMTVLAAGIKDPFGPSRTATLQTLLATASLFSTEDLATRLLPNVCHRLIDPDPAVSDTAFQVMTDLQGQLRQQVEEKRAHMLAATSMEGGTQASQELASATTGGWGTWAMSTVGTMVGNKLGSMGSIGSQDGSAGGGGGAPAAVPLSAPAAPPAPAPPAQTGGGARAQPVATAADDFDFGDLDEPDAAASAAWGGDNEDFWGEFGDDAPAPAKPQQQVARKAPMRAAPKQAPASQAPGPSSMADTGRVPGFGMSLSGAKAKPAAKPLSKPSKEEEDFWKEFDM